MATGEGKTLTAAICAVLATDTWLDVSLSFAEDIGGV
jgi:hypothetical protein